MNTAYFDNKNVQIVLKVIMLVILSYWTYILTFTSQAWIPFDWANFMIHEAGHLLFFPFGEFIYYLGGTILQLLVPSMLIFQSVKEKKLAAFNFALFWLGNNFVNVAVYIADARALQLQLFGGGGHDWNWILSELDLLRFDTSIAFFVFVVGRIILVTSLILISYDIYKTYQKRN